MVELGSPWLLDELVEVAVRLEARVERARRVSRVRAELAEQEDPVAHVEALRRELAELEKEAGR